MKLDQKTFDKVYTIVAQIPAGKVMTYKEVAQAVGLTNPRQVGYILHRNTNPKDVPCHRVIRSDGTLGQGYAFGGAKIQLQKLSEEGVVMKSVKVIIE